MHNAKIKVLQIKKNRNIIAKVIKMYLKGKVKSGLGEAAFWMKKAEKAFEKKIGIKPFYGTLNIELKNDYIFENNIIVLHKEEYGGTQDVYIKKCEILGNIAYIVRTDKNMTKDSYHPLNIIEVIADISFRNKYNLKDGDSIEITI